MSSASFGRTSVSALRLFGSVARGESDGWSDKDLLIVVPCESSVGSVRSMLDELWTTKIDISVYTEHRYRQMHAEGHLFAWHIFKESRPATLEGLASETYDLITRLGTPSTYRGSRVDAQALIDMLQHCAEGLGTEEASEVFEAGVLYVISRNLAIIASWELGCLSFSVSAPFLVGKMLGYPYPLDEATYLLLRQSRKATTSGTTPPAISRVAVLTWLQQVHDWAASLRPVIFGEVHVS